MTDISTSDVSDTSEARAVGALWVAGLGAFLLAVAAVTFVAVRWDDIPDGGKFAAVVALTSVCFAVHRWLRRSYPLTASAVGHLGALLVPIDVAAIGVRLGWEWPTMLLAQGLAATLTFGLGARIEDSVVLRWGTWAAVIALAGGVGAVTDVPAGLVVAGVALAATFVRKPHAELAVVGWAALAGLAVPLAGLRDGDLLGLGVLADLGLTAPQPAATALATGLLAGIALARLGARRGSVPLALIGIACALDGVAVAGATWSQDDSVAPLDLARTEAGVAALILLAELAAWIWSRDGFWSRPTAIVAGIGEAVAIVGTAGLALLLLAAPFDFDPLPATGLAGGLLTLTWLTAIARHPAPQPRSRPVAPSPFGGRPSGPREVVWLDGPAYEVALWTFGPILAAVTASAGVLAATGSGTAAAVALTASGVAVLVASAFHPDPKMTSGLVAVALLGWAPFAGHDNLVLAGGLGIVGGLATAIAVVALTRRFRTTWVGRTASVGGVFALVPGMFGGLVLVGNERELAGVVGAIAAAWAVAAILDRARLDEQVRVDCGLPLLWVPARIAVLAPLVLTLALTPEQAIGVAALVGALMVLDAVRLGEPLLLVGTGIAVPVGLTAAAPAFDRTLPEAGLTLCCVAVAWLGLSAVLPTRWAPPAVVAAVISAGWGLALAENDQGMFATCILVVGTAVACVGLVLGQSSLTIGGAVAVSFGYWGHLTLAEVGASESYVLPLAVGLLVAGEASRRMEGTSSWAAHAPAVLLLGGAGLVERLGGGAGGHSLVAGAVGLVAVVAGGNWRLAGPLLTGTALLVALSVHETLGVTSQFPNWVWFALAGMSLLAAGLVMERRDLGPVESGRRLLDVVHQRFT